jgi:hypothetical protein
MAKVHDGRPPHPVYGPPLSGQPEVRYGVTFRPYQVGIGQTARVSDDFRMEVRSSASYSDYRAVVDGQALPPRFRDKEGAYAAAVKAANPNKPKQVIR